MNYHAPETLHDPETDSTAQAVHALVRFLRVLRYRKVYVIAALVIAALLGALYYFTTTPMYEAKASVLITRSGPEVWNGAALPSASLDSLIHTYEQLFVKDVVLDGAVRQLLSRPPDVRIDLVGRPRNEWKDVLRNHLSARATRRTNIIELRYRSRSPRAAEAVVGAVVDAYMQFMEKHHKDVSIEVLTILDDERRDVEKQLAKKQDELLRKQREAGELNIADGSEVVHPSVVRVKRLNETLVEVQKERVQLEASLGAIQAAVRTGGDLRHHLASIEPVVGKELVATMLGVDPEATRALNAIQTKLIDDRAKLERLLAYYGPAHPQVLEARRAIQNAENYLANYYREVNRRLAGMHEEQLGPMLISMVKERLAKTRSYEYELYQQYTQAEAEAVQLNDRLAELQIVKNELVRLRELHKTLLNRIANIDINHERAEVRVALVADPTASTHPVSPKLSMVVLLCLMAGLGSGTGIVYVMDLMDDRFRSPEEIHQQLGLPVLAMVRNLSAAAEAGTDALQVHVAPEAVESEAFRTLRTTLAFSEQETDRLAVTSSEPGDGKTTVLANLAASCAQAGKRTLLVDADLRKPGLSKLLSVRRQGGLSDALRSDEDIPTVCRQLVQATGIDNLDVLPGGPKPPDPAELLSSPRMAQIIAWAETEYDQVLIDCPPVLAASETMIIGRLTDGTLMVVQPDKNHRRQVLRAAETLARMQINVLGVVANRVGDETQGYDGYSYADGYGCAYGYGHSNSVEESEHEEFDNVRSTVGNAISHVLRRRAA